jgi:hypothetical protein
VRKPVQARRARVQTCFSGTLKPRNIAWESASKMASELVEQSMQRFARTLGVTGENAQQATQQSARNAEAIAQSGTIIAGGIHIISRVYRQPHPYYVTETPNVGAG